MAREISQAIEEQWATIQNFMFIGGTAAHATLPPTPLRRPLWHRTNHYTDFSVTRQTYIEDPGYHPADPAQLLHFAPSFRFTLLGGRDEDPAPDAFTAEIGFARFGLSAAFMPKGPALPGWIKLLEPTTCTTGYGKPFQPTKQRKETNLIPNEEKGTRVLLTSTSLRAVLDVLRRQRHYIGRRITLGLPGGDND